jgi:hypothetical protein
MDLVTYNDLIERNGYEGARDLLRCIERLAEIKQDILSLDNEVRLRTALVALNAAEKGALGKGGDGCCT